MWARMASARNTRVQGESRALCKERARRGSRGRPAGSQETLTGDELGALHTSETVDRSLLEHERRKRSEPLAKRQAGQKTVATTILVAAAPGNEIIICVCGRFLASAASRELYTLDF